MMLNFLSRRNQIPLDVPVTVNLESPQSYGLVDCVSFWLGHWNKSIQKNNMVVTAGTPQPLIDCFGRGLYASGGNDTLRATIRPSTTFNQGTFTMWINRTALPGAATQWTHAGYGYGTAARVIFRSDGYTSNRMQFQWNNTSGNRVVTELSAGGGAVGFHFYVGLWWFAADGTTVWCEIYRDGVSQASASVAAQTQWAAAPTTIDFGIATRGYIYESRLYDRLLAPAEIMQLYDPATRWQLYRPQVRGFWSLPTSSCDAIIDTTDTSSSSGSTNTGGVTTTTTTTRTIYIETCVDQVP